MAAKAGVVNITTIIEGWGRDAKHLLLDVYYSVMFLYSAKISARI